MRDIDRITMDQLKYKGLQSCGGPPKRLPPPPPPPPPKCIIDLEKYPEVVAPKAASEIERFLSENIKKPKKP